MPSRRPGSARRAPAQRGGPFRRRGRRLGRSRSRSESWPPSRRDSRRDSRREYGRESGRGREVAGGGPPYLASPGRRPLSLYPERTVASAGSRLLPSRGRPGRAPPGGPSERPSPERGLPERGPSERPSPERGSPERPARLSADRPSPDRPARVSPGRPGRPSAGRRARDAGPGRPGSRPRWVTGCTRERGWPAPRRCRGRPGSCRS
jgi:hypothetical protein